MSAPESILVRAPNWIGDQILAYPFYYYLRKAYPRARIVSACVSWVKDIQFLDLVDDVFVLPKASGSGLMERLGAVDRGAKAVRGRGPFDLAISLPNSFSAAWFMYRSGAKRRRGYRADVRGLLLNESLPWNPDPGRHRTQAYVDLLPDGAKPTAPAREFWGTYPDNDLDEKIPGVKDRFDARASWSDAVALEPPKRPYWVLAPASNADSRQWPVGYFKELARKVRERTGWAGVIVGGPGDKSLARQLCDEEDLGLLDYTGKGTVSALWKVFESARFTVCNESGLAHVASLCGSPVQIVCGAADPRRTKPVGPGRVQVAVNPVECWPCERNVCIQPPGKLIQCLRGISPDRVWTEIGAGLLGNLPGESSDHQA